MNLNRKHFETEQTIIETFEDPIVIENFFSEDDIAGLKEIQEKETFYTYVKDRFHVTKPKSLLDGKYELIDDIYGRFAQYLKHDYEIQDCYLAKLTLPLPIHVDNDWDPYEKSYKRVICLYELTPGDSEPPSVILFDQRYIGDPMGFLKGSQSDLKVVRNDTTGYTYQYDSYKHLINFNDDKPFEDIQFYEENLKHIDYSNLDGLTVDGMIQHDIGKMIMWDKCQLHASKNWNNMDKGELILNIIYK